MKRVKRPARAGMLIRLDTPSNEKSQCLEMGLDLGCYFPGEIKRQFHSQLRDSRDIRPGREGRHCLRLESVPLV